MVLPALWNEKRDAKRAKLLQYAERVWNITDGSDDARIDAAIEATRHFFESLACQRVSLAMARTAVPSLPCWRNWKHTV